MKIQWLAVTAMMGCSAAAEKSERWLYIPANYQVDEQAARVAGLLARAGKAGYTHALLADSKFAHLRTVASNYRPNVEKVKAAAGAAGIELVPAVFPVGYSNDMLFHDPNLAEGLPVKNARFVVKNGEARILPDPEVALPPTATRKAWSFVDEALADEGGGFRSEVRSGNARFCKRVKVSPFRQYHVSVEIRSAGLAGGHPEIKALGAKDHSLQWTNLQVKPDQPWTRCDVTFNSLEETDVGIYFGVWGGHQGTLWWRDARLEECGPVNLLRRQGAPLTVKLENGGGLKEGTDYEPLTDPLTGAKPWPGEYTAWHTPPVIRTRTLKDGDILRVSYFHPHVIYDGQVCACVEEPAFQQLLTDQAREVPALWQSRTHLMSHDEWRVLGWDESCRKSGASPGGIVAENIRLCTGILQQQVPGGRILIWNDMADPHHNAVKNYYLVNGPLDGAWNGLSSGVDVMNWNYGKRDESLAFFAGRGNHQVIAGFYDEPLDHVADWIASADKIKGVRGFMYTTWRNDYSKLEAVAEILSKAGW